MSEQVSAENKFPELDRTPDVHWAAAELRHMAAIADYWAKRSPRGVELASCTASEARRIADEIERLTAERDQYKTKYEDTCQIVVRQANEIRRLAGPREPPHCSSCDCGSGK